MANNFHQMVYGFYIAIVDACAKTRLEEEWGEGATTLSAMNDALLNLLCNGWKVLGIKKHEAIELINKTWKFQDEVLEPSEEEDQALADFIDTLMEDRPKN